MRLVPLLVTGGALALVAAFALLLRDEPDAETSPFEPAYDAVCEAAGEARSGDVRSARRIFLNQAHWPLHELAVEIPRAEATRLLEAKTRVESLEAADARRFSVALSDLADATRAAIRATGANDPERCPA